MKKITTVSIGIPAYNEGVNIQTLLRSLLAQKESGIAIKEIIVLSDGSNDNTREKVAALKNKKIRFIDDGLRLGKSARLNHIFNIFTGEVLVLVDADVLIRDKNLIAQIVKNANLRKHGIVGINALPLPAQTYFERILETGVYVMKDIAKGWHGGNNYLSFKGAFLALDGALAKKITMPNSIVNNDAFLYFSAVQEDSRVYYRSPMTLGDHLKQSSRYQSSEGELKNHFRLDWEHHYKIPSSLMVTGMIKGLVTRPLTMVSYLGVYAYTKMYKEKSIQSTWSIAKSTKGKMSI
jgi:glycosyltransferase involved in cell wall biosynthesis